MEKARNLKLLYLHEAILSFASGMLTIVLPVFLYNMFDSIAAVFLYQLCWVLPYALIFLPLFNAAMRLKNPSLFMVIGMIFYVLSMVLLIVSEENPAVLVTMSAFSFAIYVAFYALIRHWFFSVNAVSSKIGKQVSNIAIIKHLVGFFSPIAGGLIGYLLGMENVFGLGAFLAVGSAVPILFVRNHSKSKTYSYGEVKNILKKPELRNMRSAYFWEGFSHYCTVTVWILIFFIFIGDLGSLGVFFGLSTIVAALLCRLTGLAFDKCDRTKLLTRLTTCRAGATLLYTAAYFYPGMLFVLALKTVNKFTDLMHATVVESYLFGYSSRIHPVEFHLNREVHLSISRVLIMIMLITLFNHSSPATLWLVLAAGSIMIMGWLPLARSDHLLATNKGKNVGR